MLFPAAIPAIGFPIQIGSTNEALSNMSEQVLTPKAMLSYPHLAKPQPKKKETDPSKYSVALVFAPGTDLTSLIAAAEEAVEEKWGKKGVEKFRNGGLRSPFRKDAEAKGYESGSVFINARSNIQPGMVYLYPEAGSVTKERPNGIPAKVAPEDITKVFYPGAIVRAKLSPFTYDTDGNKGVSFGLNHLQKLAEGERIDGRTDVQEAFDADLSAVPEELKELIG